MDFVEEQSDILEEIGKFQKNVYSQTGEDGILEEIFKRIGTENKVCLEVGAADGILFSNTRHLIEQGWEGILIEKDPGRYSQLVEHYEDFPKTRHYNHTIGMNGDGLDAFLDGINAPKDIDLMVIDIDGQDWHIWNQMEKYRPRVMVIEFGRDVDPWFIPPIGEEGQAGNSAMVQLATSKAYHRTINTGLNLICIRDDVADKLTKNDNKVNLGAGSCEMEGYKNLDIKQGQNAYPLDCPDGSLDEIRASHLLEHFSHKEVFSVVKNWVDKLKMGGVLKIAVPDFAKLIEMYNKKEDPKLGMYIMGGQTDENDFHKSLFDEDCLTTIMESAGLSNIQRWTSETTDCSSYPFSLNLMGTKSSEKKAKHTVSAIMSMPRLTFTDSITCVMRHVVARGIPFLRSSGVFWGQCLTRMIEGEIKKDYEYIMTIDYDVWFDYSDIQAMLSLMDAHPEYDAVMPVHIRREGPVALFAVDDENGKLMDTVPMERFKDDIVPVRRGHFGLTIFRKSCFDKIKKPWFIPKEGPDGSWNEGHLDEDIVFWENFRDAGCKLGLATNVRIGHLEFMVNYPSDKTKGFKPIYKHISELEKGV